MIRNVLFDLDDTLLDFKRAEAVAIRRTLYKMGIDPNKIVNVALTPCVAKKME